MLCANEVGGGIVANATTAIVKHAQTTEDKSMVALRALEDAMATDPQAVVQMLHTISLLRANGVLDIMNAFLEQSEDIFKIIVDQAGKPGYAEGLKNVLAVLQMFGSFDLRVFVSPVTKTAKSIEEGTVPRVNGVMDMWRYLHDPDVSLGLGMMLSFLKGIGEAVNQTGMQSDPVADPS